MRVLSLLLIAVLGVGCASVAQRPGPSEYQPSALSILGQFDDPELGEVVRELNVIFSERPFLHAHWGALVQSLDTGKIWYERNADRMFMPASNQKIVTTAPTLLELGPDWTFSTTLGRTGPIVDGVLEGDLVVRGNGDPTMYTRFQDDPRDVFYDWADILWDMGVRRIEGDIVGDDNNWEEGTVDDDWPISNLTWWYGAPFGPLQLNENYIDLTFTPPAEPGGRVEITPNIPTDYITIINNLQAVEGRGGGFNLDRHHEANVLTFSGNVTAGGDPFERSPAVANPTLYFVTVLRETLESEGIEVDGDPVDIDQMPVWRAYPRRFEEVAVHRSPPLSEILTGLMKRSQNLYAETMPRTLAQERTGTGSFSEGRRIIMEHLEALGVPGEVRYSDGSGLSRYNYVSPRQLVAILDGMSHTEHFDVWYATFPIAGVDGTLRSRMRGTPAEGNVHAKTGTISNTRGLSGYVTTADGERLVFSFLVNGHLLSTSDTNRVTDSACALLAGFDRDAD